MEVLLSVRRYRLLQVHHVQRLHFTEHATSTSAARVCRRVLQRLTEQRLLSRLERRIGGQRAGSAGHVYTLSPLGHRLLGTPNRQRHHEPSYGFVRHTLAIAELTTALVERCWAGDGVTITGWHIQTEPTAWRDFHGDGRTITLKPDLAIVLRSDDYELRWFVEVDLGTEARPTLERKLQTYTAYWRSGIEQAEHDIFPRTLWVVPDEQRLRQLERAIEGRHIESSLFAVTTSNRALDVLADFGEDEA